MSGKVLMFGPIQRPKCHVCAKPLVNSRAYRDGQPSMCSYDHGAAYERTRDKPRLGVAMVSGRSGNN